MSNPNTNPTKTEATPLRLAAKTLKTKSLLPWFGLSFFLFVADQLTKWLIVDNLEFGTSVYILPFFNLVYVLNPGAAFGILASQPGWQLYFLSAVAIGVAVFIIWLMYKNENNQLELVGLSLILAGALGNLIDRLLFGAVVDFLDFHLLGYHFPAFNVADSCISIGFIVIMSDLFYFSRKRTANNTAA